MENGQTQQKSNGNGWSEWSKWIIKELERQAEEDKAIKDEQTNQGKQIARLEVKAGLWGIVGGIATILVYIAVELIKKGNV